MQCRRHCRTPSALIWRPAALIASLSLLASTSLAQGPTMPAIEPITAVAKGDTTIYSVRATSSGGAPLSYVWSLSRPCGLFTANAAQAVWVHTGCPSDALSSATVSVAVADDRWRCSMLYANGARAGTGTSFLPGRCAPALPNSTTSGAAATAPQVERPQYVYPQPSPGFDPGLVQIGAGYQWLHAVSDSGTFNTNGWVLMAMINESQKWAFDVQISGAYRTVNERTINRYIYVFGVQYAPISKPGYRIFLTARAGGAHDRVQTPGQFGGFITASANTFALGLGTGLDVRITKNWSWRVVQADYIPTHFASSWQSNYRLISGPVFGFSH